MFRPYEVYWVAANDSHKPAVLPYFQPSIEISAQWSLNPVALWWVYAEMCTPCASYDLRKTSKLEICSCNIVSSKDICSNCSLMHTHKYERTHTHTHTGGTLEMNRWDRLCVKDLSRMQQFYPYRCNWATDTHTNTHTYTLWAPPLPFLKVHPSSLWLLHRLSNCMPKHVCVYVCVCDVFTCV